MTQVAIPSISSYNLTAIALETSNQIETFDLRNSD